MEYKGTLIFEIECLIVRPSKIVDSQYYMRKGYGSKLLEFVMNELKKQGFTDVFLWVLEENNSAREFYN